MTEELHIDVQSANSEFGLIALSGFINLDTSEILYEAIQDVFHANASRALIFNVGEVDYVSSAGVGVFMSLYEELEEKGGKIAFVGLTDSFRRVLDLLGFMQYFGDCDSLETAQMFVASP
jgi:anti-sigma B factor antagonist